MSFKTKSNTEIVCVGGKKKVAKTSLYKSCVFQNRIKMA